MMGRFQESYAVADRPTDLRRLLLGAFLGALKLARYSAYGGDNMPTYNVTLSTWTNIANGSGAAWTNPGNAELLDGSNATCSGESQATDFLQGIGPSMLGSAFAPNEYLEGITIAVTRETLQGSATDQHLYLVSGGTMLTAIDFAQPSVAWPSTLAAAEYAVGASQLVTLGLTNSSITSSFGVALSADPPLQPYIAAVDQIAMTFTTTYQAIPDEMSNPPTFDYLPSIGLSNQ